MGWSADALKNGLYIDIQSDADARSAFAAAAGRVRKLCGSCDGFLEDGGVHLSVCRQVLRDAAGRDVNGEILSPADVVSLLESCEWEAPESIEENHRSGYWSIRVLLETCANSGYGLEVNI